MELLERSRDGSSPGRGALKDIFQIVIVVGVEPSNSQEFLGAFQLALHDSVFPAGRGLQCQTTVGPQLPLGAKTMWRLHQSNEQSRPYRSDRRNLAQQVHRAVFPAFGQQISSYLLTQRSQCVQLLVVDLRPAMHAGFADLGEPFRAIAWCVHALARAGNRRTPLKALYAVHPPRAISRQSQVAAGQFFQNPSTVLPVVDRGEKPAPEKIGQLAS